MHDNNKLLQDELSRTRDSLSVFESENETFKLNEAKWKEELKQLKENVSKLDKNATSDKEQCKKLIPLIVKNEILTQSLVQ